MSELRIIAGTARGRKIKTFKDDLSVRPILARMKKSVFDILKTRICDSSFLDLYAGTGAVGIEAISRGARHAVFVDADNKCVNLIKENLKNLKFDAVSDVYQSDVLKGLEWLRAKFDLVYMGPPYKDKDKVPLSLVNPTLEAIEKAGILMPGGIIIAQHHKKEMVSNIGALVEVRNEKYGDTIISFYEKAAG
ncbi:MAG: 16S rRNA (guanine(966)-N(2))-methyltransferase RsmD [Elusimicrobia bacterium]|nr:16S rRNA (guanine(966)-N(2))-methyltransferase RsmD [Candidatus Liberimonas magnetica]